MTRLRTFILKAGALAFLFFLNRSVLASIYEVGPAKTYPSIGVVPWENLQPGDTVLIFWRTNSYAEKFVLCRQGTASAPITIRGVPGPDGALPVLTGENATTRSALSFWGETRAVIKIGGANKPTDTTPRFITIENLEVRSARPPFIFSGASGLMQNYAANAASIWIEKGENITIRNCVFHDSGNGFFVSSTDALASKNILVEGCYIFDNGNPGSIYEHNVYAAALGITFQFNRFGPLRTNCAGNNLKDRSAGLVVRYNWIEGGSRQLDLVDAEDSIILRNDPSYRATHVYGNVIFEPKADGNKQLIHYGGDSGTTANYRKGTLYFFHNTVVSKRPDQTTLFRFDTNEEQGDARNNIFYATNSGNMLALLDAPGVLRLSHNWIKSGFKSSFSTLTGTIVNDGPMLTNSVSPGFIDEAGDEFRLATNSICINAGGMLNTNVLPAHEVVMQYLKHQAWEMRAINGAPDVGAFELRSPLETWRALTFGTNVTNAAVSSDAADPDGDDLSNFAEYALAEDPLVPSTNRWPLAKVISTGGESFLAIFFSIRPPPSGVVYIVQSSRDLVTWTDGCRFSDATNISSAGETVEVSAPDTTNKIVRARDGISSATNLFLRVRLLKE